MASAMGVREGENTTKNRITFRRQTQKKNAEGLPVSHHLKLPIWGWGKKKQ